MKNCFIKGLISAIFTLFLFNSIVAAKTYYSIDNGALSKNTNWSVEGYTGIAAEEFPSGSDTIRIGNSKIIELDGDFIINKPGVVIIDTYGTLLCGSKILSGSGAFIIERDGSLGIGDENAITQSEPKGNIQTTKRYYNGLNNHNSSSFIFTGKNQTISNNSGLPQFLKQIIINLSSIDSKLNFNTPIMTILRSVEHKRGILNLGADWNFGGTAEMNFSDIAEFNPMTSTISFSGVGSNYISSGSSKPIKFYNLKLNKPNKNSSLNLDNSTSISILNRIIFSDVDGYKSTINCRTNYQSFIRLEKNASIVNASNSTGWINGELRKYIDDGTDKREVIFEIGDSASYSPITLNLSKGTNTSSGFISGLVMFGNHQYLNYHYNISINPDRTIGPKWWRLMNPKGSEFMRGDRTLDIKFQFTQKDVVSVDYFGCTDISYIRSWTENVDWQSLYPMNTKSNDGKTGCSDTRSKHNEAFEYTGESIGDLYSTEIKGLTANIRLGNSELIEDNILLGDFVVGNQFSTSDIIEDNSSNTLEIYPNPVTNYLTIRGSNNENMHFQIYSIDGVLMMESNSGEMIDISNLATGLYFVKNGTQVKRFIKL